MFDAQLTLGDFTFWPKTFAEPIRWAKPKAGRKSLYLDQSSIKKVEVGSVSVTVKP